jgi:hypothetical protein
MPSHQIPAVGDRVGVPWGLDVLEGLVLRIYETGTGARAVVLVHVPGADDEPESRTVTLPTVDLLPIGEGHELEAPGSWVDEYQFEKAVGEALNRVVLRLAESAEVETEPRLGGQRADAIVKIGDHLVVVEAKRVAQTPAAFDQLASFLRQVRADNPDAFVGGLLVLQSGPRGQVARELAGQGLAIVNWNTPRDDQKLTAALTRLLEAA